MSSFGHQERTSISVLANLADHQERQYRRYIEQNETMGNGIAMRLARGEQFEELMLLGGNENQKVVEECRASLKELAKDNVAKSRQLGAYVSAIRVVIDNASTALVAGSQRRDDGSANAGANANEVYEFKDQMDTEYASALKTIETNSVLVTQEPTYLNLCRHLGEDQESDDELAVVNNPSSNSNSNSDAGIKCPLTMAIMEDPVRSKVCKHSFDRLAITSHLSKSKMCPVPGCRNSNMTPSELEDDPDTVMKVRRYKKRESAARKVRAQSALDMDDMFDF